MIVDTSALVSIFSAEPEQRTFAAALAGSPGNLVSTGSWIELATVLVRRFGQKEVAQVQQRLASVLRLTLVPVDAEQAAAARDGYGRFGRDSGHRARLNFGDCFAYGLAKTTGEPLLFKGSDFNHTDLLLAPESSYPR